MRQSGVVQATQAGDGWLVKREIRSVPVNLQTTRLQLLRALDAPSIHLLNKFFVVQELMQQLQCS